MYVHGIPTLFFVFFFFFLSDLAQVFRAVMKQHNLAPGDFPDLEPFRAKLADTNFVKFPKLKVKMLEDLDEVSFGCVPSGLPSHVLVAVDVGMGCVR